MSEVIYRSIRLMLFAVAGLFANRSEGADPNLAAILANSADVQRIPMLVRELDSNEFANRESATAELLKIGEPALPAVKAALERSASLEVKSRCGHLLRQIIPWEGMPHELSLPDLMKLAKKIQNASDPEAACRDAQLASVLDCWVRVLGQVSGHQGCRPPVRISDVKFDHFEPGTDGACDASDSLLVIKRGHLGLISRCIIIADEPIEIDDARECVIIGRSIINVDRCQSCVILAGFFIEGSHAAASYAVGGSQVHLAEAANSVIAAGSHVSIEFALRDVLVNSSLDGEFQQIEVSSARLPELRLANRPTANPLGSRLQLVDTLWEGDVVAKIRVDGGKQTTVRCGGNLTGADGKQVPGLEKWKLLFANRGSAVFTNGEDFLALSVRR